MSDRLNPEQKPDVACPIYFITPDKAPLVQLPQKDAQLEQPMLSEAGQTESGFSANTSTWD